MTPQFGFKFKDVLGGFLAVKFLGGRGSAKFFQRMQNILKGISAGLPKEQKELLDAYLKKQTGLGSAELLKMTPKQLVNFALGKGISAYIKKQRQREIGRYKRYITPSIVRREVAPVPPSPPITPYTPPTPPMGFKFSLKNPFVIGGIALFVLILLLLLLK